MKTEHRCGSVGTGRRARLRILWWLHRVGSSPIFRRVKDKSQQMLRLIFYCAEESLEPGFKVSSAQVPRRSVRREEGPPDLPLDPPHPIFRKSWSPLNPIFRIPESSLNPGSRSPRHRCSRLFRVIKLIWSMDMHICCEEN